MRRELPARGCRSGPPRRSRAPGNWRSLCPGRPRQCRRDAAGSRPGSQKGPRLLSCYGSRHRCGALELAGVWIVERAGDLVTDGLGVLTQNHAALAATGQLEIGPGGLVGDRDGVGGAFTTGLDEDRDRDLRLVEGREHREPGVGVIDRIAGRRIDTLLELGGAGLAAELNLFLAFRIRVRELVRPIG